MGLSFSYFYSYYYSSRKIKTLIIIRGLPESGKSTLANQLLDTYVVGNIFSTKDYFINRNGKYSINHKKYKDAELWNVNRVKNSMEEEDENSKMIVIDNNNIRLWEAKPYVLLAQKYNYKIVILEANYNKNIKKTRYLNKLKDKYVDNKLYTVENIVNSMPPKNYS